MSDAVATAVINGLFFLLTAVINGVVVGISRWLSSRENRATNAKVVERADTCDAKIEVIHAATNSMKDELVREVRAAAFAAGEKSQKDNQNCGATSAVR